MSARAGMALLRSVREALLSDEGRRIGREIRRLLDDADQAPDEPKNYAEELLARSRARARLKAGVAATQNQSGKRTQGTRRA